MLLELAAAASFAVLIYFGFTDNPPRLLGVYSQPGKFFTLKRWLFWLLLKLRQRKGNDASSKEGEKKVGGYGKKSYRSLAEMESPQKLDPHPHGIDTAYFTSVAKDGTVFVLRIGRRHDRKAELWMTLKIPGIGFLQCPNHPDTEVCNTDGCSISAGGLRFECVEPMRRWKVSFNGLLRKGLWNDYAEKDKGEIVHVKFSFIWEAFTDVFDFDTDMDPGILADAVAREPWTKEYFNSLQGKHQTHYEQWGEMLGTVYVEGYDERKMYLKCMRDHSYGVRDWRDFHRYIVHFCYLEDGTTFHVSTICLPDALSYLKTGYVGLPCGVMVPVTYSSLELHQVGENGSPVNRYSFSFSAGGKTYRAEVTLQEAARYYHHRNWTSTIHECISTVEVNGVKGWGIAEYCYRYDGGSPVPEQHSVSLLREYDISCSPGAQCPSFVLPFSSPYCTSSKLVGGKGCQLALLTQLTSKDFTVPFGVCLTTGSFEHHLTKLSELTKAIEQLAAISSGMEKGDLKVTCEATVDLIKNTTINKEIQATMKSHLEKEFGADAYEEKLFAVRSSAVGEDGADMSAAGQMETFLGVKGMQQICQAVVKCWASNFAFQAVEYRRQHGQPIKSSVAVVIQEMVASEVSGVLFTQDPLTQNPALMTINANYGLGESVVSGSAEPDTIKVKKTWDNKLQIHKIEFGRKSTQITLKDEGGTTEDELNTSTSDKCCLPDETILKLANIGVQLEKHFADPRDVEWAVKNNIVYVLQARPITTLSVESDWLLMHEFDTPLATDSEALTTCNIGEMMPGAMTPLSISTFFRAIEYAFQDMLKKSGILKKHYELHKFMALQSNTAFINLFYTYGLTDVHTMNGDKNITELSLMGETIESTTKDDILKYWGKSPLHIRLLNSVRMFRMLSNAYKKTLKWESLVKTYTLGIHSHPKSLYKAIDGHLPSYIEVWTDTFENSASSGSWSSVLLSILSQGKTEWTTDHLSDVALLLAKCEDVYSADVPTALKGLAIQMKESGKADSLRQMSTEEAVGWLQSSDSGEAGTRFASFLDKHGHRCVREAEMFEKSWRDDPQKIVQVLQAMLQSPLKEESVKIIEDVETSIRKLKSDVTYFGRQILKWAIPKARQAVGRREWGKSIAIQMSDKFKKAYWELADMMKKEGFLPEKELLFFLTHGEIGTVLEERSGRLIARAQRRRRLLSKQMSQRYPRLSFGHPKPVVIAESVETNRTTTFQLKGMPVSQGEVTGVCRVVLSLQDASLIQAGEILVVTYTDVGWSPYFPLISGLVTEIGGLLSHGAVVAREYGLPCLVNVQAATTLLKTGDTVVLDGTKGTIKKLE